MDSLVEVKVIYKRLYGIDKDETMCRKDIEESLGGCVATFQKFEQSRYNEVTGKQVLTNDFQIIDKGRKMFSDIGFGYEKWVLTDEINKAIVYFQMRHVIEHNDGIINDEYLSKTDDPSYEISQRIVVKKDDIYDLSAILRKIR